MFGDDDKREKEHKHHHAKAQDVSHVIDTGGPNLCGGAKEVRQKTAHNGPHRQSHRIGPMRLCQFGLHIHIRCCGLAGFDEPRAQSSLPQRSPYSDKDKGRSETVKRERRQKQTQRYEAGQNRGQKDRLAPD